MNDLNPILGIKGIDFPYSLARTAGSPIFLTTKVDCSCAEVASVYVGERRRQSNTLSRTVNSLSRADGAEVSVMVIEGDQKIQKLHTSDIEIGHAFNAGVVTIDFFAVTNTSFRSDLKIPNVRERPKVT